MFPEPTNKIVVTWIISIIRVGIPLVIVFIVYRKDSYTFLSI